MPVLSSKETSNELLDQVSALFQLLFEVLRKLPKKSSWRFHEINQSIVHMGVESLAIIMVSTAFNGVIITEDMAWHMQNSLHTVDMIPGFTAQFIFRELGIMAPALLLVSKVGASTTAEIGTMKITEQIDAIKLLGIDPVTYLVIPRFIAAIVASVCLTWIAIAVTLSFASLVAVFKYHFSLMEYLNSIQHFIKIKDIAFALVKGSAYGAMIPIISCAYGFRCKGGAEGVGTATNQAVIAGMLMIILLDFILTYFFTWI